MKPLQLELPLDVKEVLLHTCCAPCSSAIIECMLANGIRPIVFFYNPNIYPLSEYEIRKGECRRYAESLGLTIVDGDYLHEQWLQQMRGMEQEPERGGRCQRCFDQRMLATAQYAESHGYQLFTTTLASSRWKSLEQINRAGRAAMKYYPTTLFWEQNWRKGGLSERRRELITTHQFYNQQYCGCEFSMRRLGE